MIRCVALNSPIRTLDFTRKRGWNRHSLRVIIQKGRFGQRDAAGVAFCVQKVNEECAVLVSQIVISSWVGTRYLPIVFTEQGVEMLSSVLKSERAIKVNIAMVRTFVRIREILKGSSELEKKLKELMTVTTQRPGDHE